MSCDWMRVSCSPPVSRFGFISSFSTVWAPHICQKKLREPARQPDSQLDRKQSGWGVGGCEGWFMPCFGMLNEFRVHFCVGLNGHCLLTYLHPLTGYSLNVKIWRQYDTLLNIYKWNFQHITRQTEKEMNHSRPLIYISCQYPAS